MQPKQGKVTGGPVPLAYVEWGRPDAPPVVLLHGLRAYGYWFEEFAEVAADRFRLIALDQRGRGASGWAQAGGYTTDDYVADVAVVARELRLGRFALVGHSMGGTNAVNYAAAYPDTVSALVIVDSAPELDPVGLNRIRSELGRTASSFASRAEARTFLRGLHTRASERSIETRLEWMLRTEADGSMHWRIDSKIFDPNMRPDAPERMWDALAKIRCPTLVVRGMVSDIVTMDCADRMAKVLAKGERAEIPEAAHMIVEDNPAGFNAAVIPFLSKVLLS